MDAHPHYPTGQPVHVGDTVTSTRPADWPDYEWTVVVIHIGDDIGIRAPTGDQAYRSGSELVLKSRAQTEAVGTDDR